MRSSVGVGENPDNNSEPGVIFMKNIHNSWCGPDCIVEGRVENSILAGNVHVKPHAVVRNSILLSNAEVDEYSLVDHCILEEDVKVEKFCYLGRPHRLDSSDITVVEKGSVVSQYDSILLNYRKSSLAGFEYLDNSSARLKVGAR